MITSFKHKGLEKFFTHATKKGIQPEHSTRLLKLLTSLNAASHPGDMDFSGAFFHPLKNWGENLYSVRVNGNWRVTFRFVNGNAEDVDYVDYH